MPCYWPRSAWLGPGGSPVFREPPDGAGYVPLRLPCGGCIGCRIKVARDWTIRCLLELREHDDATWATLTYDDDHLPPTLVKPHLSGYLKRLREAVFTRAWRAAPTADLTPPERRALRQQIRQDTAVRFFGVGEFGDRTNRPHYHVILYGVARDDPLVQLAWKFGHVRSDPVTPQSIAYTAGYAQKKIRRHYGPARSFIVPDGERLAVLKHQEPFRLCSRRPGIAGSARRFTTSWRDSAIHRGVPVSVPRYLHNAWREIASENDLAALESEREYWRESSLDDAYHRRAGEAIALAKHKLQTERRTL